MQWARVFLPPPLPTLSPSQTASHAAEMYVLPGLLPGDALRAVLAELDSLDVALDTDPGGSSE